MYYEFVHVLRNIAKGSKFEVVILTNANTMERFHALLGPAVERARAAESERARREGEFSLEDAGYGFEEELAKAIKRIEENNWLFAGVNTLLIDSRWNWSDWQMRVEGAAFKELGQSEDAPSASLPPTPN